MAADVQSRDTTPVAPRSTPRSTPRPTSHSTPRRAVRARSATRRRLPHWRWLLVLRPRRDLLLVLALAAALRLPQLGGTIFLDDQEELLALARSALAHGALPASGIRASIGTLNFPAISYLLLPFAALGNPYWAALATALANVAAAGLLYGVTARYAGRRAALAAALLYAAAPWPVYFSRFIWQQNLLAPVVILFFWTACRGAIERKRGWLPWNLLLWAIAVQLHPSAAPLLALTAIVLLVTWRDLRWRDGLGAVLALALPFVPTLLWELATSGSDLALYQAYALRPAVLDGNVLGTLLAVLTPPDPGLFGPATAYARWFGTFGWARVALVVLYAAGILWMVAALLAARRRREEWAAPRLPVARLGRPCPMFLLLAMLWQAAPLLAMLRHSTYIQEHYLLAVMPALFLTMGLFIAWVGERADLAATLAREPLRLAAWWLPNVVLVALIGAQALASGTFVASAQVGYDSGPQAFHYTRYGIPLDTQQAALDALLRAANAGHAHAEIAASTWGEPGFGYLASIASQPVSVYDGTRCALAPAAGSDPAAVLAMQPPGAANLLAELAGNTGSPALAGQQANPLRLYAIRPGATLPGETALPTALPALTASAGSRAYLAGYRLHVTNDGGARLVLHFSGTPPAPSPSAAALTYWRGALPGVGGIAQYTFSAQPLDAAGKPLGPGRSATCSELHWGPGDDLYAWIDLPATSATAPGGWRITSERQEYTISRPHVGPLALESGDLALGPVERVASGIIPVAPAAS